MGQHPQLDLGIVGVHQHLAVTRPEELAQVAADFGADRDILHIGLNGADAAGPGLGLLETGVNPAVLPHHLQKAVHIGGFQFGQLAVFQNIFNDGVFAPQGLQHVGIGGIAAFGLFAGGQPQLVKEDSPQLLGGVDVELLPCMGVDAGLQPGDVHIKALAKGDEAGDIQLHPDALHVRQHLGQGDFNIPQQGILPMLHNLGGEPFPQGDEPEAVAPQSLPFLRQFGAGEGGHLVFVRQPADGVFGGGRA